MHFNFCFLFCKFSSQGREKFAKVSAYAKGVLTRLLLRTEKVHALIQTVKVSTTNLQIILLSYLNFGVLIPTTILF